MATGTTGSRFAVIKHGTRPAVGGMAIITTIARLNVIEWLAQGCASVMTTATGADHRRMVHPADVTKTTGTVAHLTAIGGIDMI